MAPVFTRPLTDLQAQLGGQAVLECHSQQLNFTQHMTISAFRLALELVFNMMLQIYNGEWLLKRCNKVISALIEQLLEMK